LTVLAASAAAPTFNKDVAPILYNNCVTCHRPGEVAPFSLMTYPDAAKRAVLIAAVTKQRVMPPWKPEPGFGSFANDRRLSDEQIAIIRVWAQAGAPEGDAHDKPALPVFQEGWQAGQPDKILSVPRKIQVEAEGPDQYRCFVLPLNTDHEVYVSGMEFRPGNRRVVHHALVYLDASGEARKLAAQSGDGGYSCFGGPGFLPSALLGGWAPGATPPVNAPDLAQPVKVGTDVVMQIHYHPTGKAEEDQSELGLQLSGPPTKGRASVIVANRHIFIPAGESHYVMKGFVTLPRDVDLIGITPHAHYLATDMKIDAHLPDGTTKALIWIKDWDFNWQGQYSYKEAVHLPEGTRIELEYVYNNSEANPHNPSHPALPVKYGEGTRDEMTLAFLGVALPSPADVLPFHKVMRMRYLEALVAEGNDLNDLPRNVPSPEIAMLKSIFNKFDKDGDGKLDAQERVALVQYLQANEPSVHQRAAQPTQ
jgi:hypothetical protein